MRKAPRIIDRAVDKHTLAYVFYGVGITSILFVMVRTFYRLSKQKKDTGFARKKVGPESEGQVKK